MMDEMDQVWLYDLGLIDTLPKEPKVTSDAEDNYNRAMEILL